jgi:DnaD/phage-associated family protein
MSDINLKLGYKCSTVEIPTVFIDRYMTDCLPVYPLIYIWSLRRILHGESVSMQEIGEVFRVTEADVIKAWRHWEKERLVSISSSKQGMEITFLPMPQHDANEASVITEETVSPPPESRPQYTAQELACYRNESRDVERLFSRAEQALGKLLSYNDMNLIFGFYDWLRLPIEVVEYLLTYCAENDHRSLRYIEKCAMDWADHDIKDLEQALTYVQNFDRSYRTIMRHMGQVGYPTAAQRKFMDKWLHEWNLPLELITEACDRCILNINKFDRKYTEKILSEWHKKDITTLEQVSAADEEFSAKAKPFIQPAKQKNNRFINFNQREKDYSQIEKLERAYLEKKYSTP